MKRAKQAAVGLFLVVAIVGLNVAVAIILSWLAEWRSLGLAPTVVLLGLLGVIVIHGCRFGVWWWVHRRMDLSRSAPLTAMFFPAILLTEIARGGNPSWAQIGGVLLITVGAAWATAIQETRSDPT